MKLVATVAGTAIVNVPIDDVGPTYGLGQVTLIDAVKALYNFNVAPQIRPNMANLPMLNFQAGTFLAGAKKHAIAQLTLAPDGDAVLANNTDNADEILTDYIGHLNQDLGYRYSGKELRHYFSVVVVEFDLTFAERVKALDAIQKTISKSLAGAPYQLKTMSFGVNADEPVPTASIMQLMPRDFVIDRRASAAFNKNRFYCSAPLKTGDHLNTLQAIEKLILESN